MDYARQMLTEELVMMQVNAASRDELLQAMGNYLYQKGYVKDSFTAAVLEREKTYPTGLPTEDVKIALPHTYPVHAKKPGILVANLANPVVFCEMGDGAETVEAELVFMVVVTDPEREVQVLRRLMELFVQPGALREIKQAQSATETCAILTKLLRL